MFDWFAWKVAMRHLRYNIGQTLLTMGVVAISVTLIIFLGALIGGLQLRLLNTMTGAIPHVVIRQPERLPIALWNLPQVNELITPLYTGNAVKLEQQKRTISDWLPLLDRLENTDQNIIAVSPVVDGSGFISRGAGRRAVTVNGILPERHNQIVDLESDLVSGRFFGLNAGEVVMGFSLSADLGMQTGDKVHITSEEGITATYTLAGIFDTGYSAIDKDAVFITLRDAQSLFAVGHAITAFGLKLDQVLEADNLAERLELQLPYESTSWMSENRTQLTGLRAQNQSSNMIITFTIVAAGFGIASILITSVVNKIREIGILKAMGATQKQIIRIFTLEGTLLAFLGGLFGIVQGVGICLYLSQFEQIASETGRTTEVFPINLTPGLILGSLLTAIIVGFLASLYPAWQAARVNPIEVIRGL